MSEGAFAGRLAVVTGATRGLGHAVALALAAGGAHVVALGRKTAPLEALDDDVRRAGGEPPTLVPLDLTDGAGIDRLGAAIAQRWGALDILVGCAAVLGQISPLPHVKAKTFEEVMAVNVTANWRLLRTLHPVLRQAQAARVVMVTCAAGHEVRPNWGPYAASKRALEALVETYAREVEEMPIRINAFDPGIMGTGLHAAAAPGDKLETLPHPREAAADLLPLLTAQTTRNGAIVTRTAPS